MDTIKIKCKSDIIEFTVNDRHEMVKYLIRGLDRDEEVVKNSPSDSIPSMSIWEKWSLWEYQDITLIPSMYENFKDLKRKIDNGETHFNKMSEQPLLQQITRYHVGILNKDEREENKIISKGSVMVGKREYKKMKKKCMKKGKTPIYDKFGHKSWVYMKSGKLYDSDGDREIITPSMSQSKGLNPYENISNPLMKKVFDECRKHGFSNEQSFDYWSQVMGDLTKEFHGKDIDKVNIELHYMNPNNPYEVN